MTDPATAGSTLIRFKIIGTNVPDNAAAVKFIIIAEPTITANIKFSNQIETRIPVTSEKQRPFKIPTANSLLNSQRTFCFSI